MPVAPPETLGQQLLTGRAVEVLVIRGMLVQEVLLGHTEMLEVMEVLLLARLVVVVEVLVRQENTKLVDEVQMVEPGEPTLLQVVPLPVLEEVVEV